MMRKKTLFVMGFAGALVLAVTAMSDSDEVSIRSVLDRQVSAWNDGDIRGFVEGYKKSPDLLFASGGKLAARGWDALLERYSARYPAGHMGHLTFDGIEINRLGEDYAWAVGFWRLEKDGETPHGAFTLLFERTPEGWRIIHDHTSLNTEE